MSPRPFLHCCNCAADGTTVQASARGTYSVKIREERLRGFELDVVSTRYREVEDLRHDPASESVRAVVAGAREPWYQMTPGTAVNRPHPSVEGRDFANGFGPWGAMGSLRARFESPSLRQDGAADAAAPSLLRDPPVQPNMPSRAASRMAITAGWRILRSTEMA